MKINNQVVVLVLVVCVCVHVHICVCCVGWDCVSKFNNERKIIHS